MGLLRYRSHPVAVAKLRVPAPPASSRFDAVFVRAVSGLPQLVAPLASSGQPASADAMPVARSSTNAR